MKLSVLFPLVADLALKAAPSAACEYIMSVNPESPSFPCGGDHVHGWDMTYEECEADCLADDDCSAMAHSVNTYGGCLFWENPLCWGTGSCGWTSDTILAEKVCKTPSPTPRPTPPPTPAPTGPSCMSGEARVEASGGLFSENHFKYVKDLTTGDTIQGLDENMEPSSCTIEAVGSYGTGTVFGNYTKDHFILGDAQVMPNGPVGEMDTVEKYAVLTSCPVGLDESGVGFTPFDSDFFADGPLSWSDYVVVHKSILNIVKEVGPFVFSPSTYTSMGKVKQYTARFYKTMLACAKPPNNCIAFERAAKDLVDNSLTDDAKGKVKSGFRNLGKSKKRGSIAAAVSKGKSVRD